MTTSLFVISDLHLGGAENFQMCSAAGRKRLVKFVHWVATQKAQGEELRLVINGDIVDFLAEVNPEGGYSAFIADEDQAVATLERIAQSCEDVFAALKRLLAAGGGLVLLLGNHDIELSFPKVRQELLRRLGPGHIEFIYDNEAYPCGPVLIEHGNRYDAWNMVNHGRLRAVCSAFSRRQKAASFPAQPGSELVARVMNPIKEIYGFVDLMKPETGAVVPMLPLLDAAKWKSAEQTLRQKIEAWQRDRFTEEGVPVDSDYIAGEEVSDSAPVELPAEFKGPLDQAAEIAREVLDGRGDCVGWLQELPARALLKGFRSRRKSLDSTFAVEVEDPEYLTPAQALASRGFKVVLFGHTHLAKRVALEGSSIYLNTGTWADLIRLPAGIYEADEDAAFKLFQVFLDDVKNNRIDGYRRQVATFACVRLDAQGALFEADANFFDDDGSVSPISTVGLSQRLA